MDFYFSMDIIITFTIEITLIEDYYPGPRNLLDYMMSGVSELNRQQWSSAILDFTRALELDPNNSAAYKNRAGAFIKAGKYDQGFDDLTIYLRLKPDDLDQFFGDGVLFAASNKSDYTRGISLLTEAIGMYPYHSYLYYSRGRAYLETENTHAAMLDLNKAIELNPKKPDYYYHRAIGYVQKGKYSTSRLEYYGEYLSAASDYQKYLQLGGIENKAHVEEQIQLLNAGDHTVKGILFQERTEFDKAISEYDTAITIAPNFPYPYERLFTVYIARNDMQRAFSNIEKAIQINPKNANYLLNRGTIYSQTGRNEFAIEDYRAAIQIQPDFAAAYQNIGAIHLQKQELDQAIDNFTKAITFEPSVPLPYAYRGYASYLKGDHRFAVADWKKYCALGGDPTYELTVEQIQGYIKALEEEL